MKKVLIELATGRLCDIVTTPFPVADGLLWADAPDVVSHETHFWNGSAVVLKPPRPIAEVKTEKLAELQRARDAAEQADVTVQGKQFSASKDIADRFEKLSARLRRGKPTALAAIFTTDGTPVSPVTAQLLEQIEDAIAAQGEAAWNKYGQLVGQVMAATTVEQVNAIVW